MGIEISQRGDFSKSMRFLQNIVSKNLAQKLDKYGRKGVDALRQATPRDTGKTAESWGYEVHTGRDSVELVWTNSNENRGLNIAVLIQYGHATRGGGYVQGRDYINPAMRPIFDEIAHDLWEEVIEDGNY